MHMLRVGILPFFRLGYGIHWLYFAQPLPDIITLHAFLITQKRNLTLRLLWHFLADGKQGSTSENVCIGPTWCALQRCFDFQQLNLFQPLAWLLILNQSRLPLVF